VPLVGRIAAGGPILAEESIEEYFPLPRQIVGEGTLFLLKVVGDSMINAAIAAGTGVVVRQQPVAGERRYRRGDDRWRGHGQDVQALRRPRLADAAQPFTPPIPGDDAAILAAWSPCCALLTGHR